MRSQLSFRLESSLRSSQLPLLRQDLTLKVTVKFILVLQSEICKPYRPGPNDCPVAAKTAERLKKTSLVSRSYPLSEFESAALPLEPKFQRALMPCIDARNYAVLLEFDWGDILWGVVFDMVRDPSKRLPEPSNSHRPFDRGQYWCTHQNASDFDPDPEVNVKWKVTLNNDLWYGFYVVPAT